MTEASDRSSAWTTVLAGGFLLSVVTLILALPLVECPIAEFGEMPVPFDPKKPYVPCRVCKGTGKISLLKKWLSRPVFAGFLNNSPQQ